MLVWPPAIGLYTFYTQMLIKLFVCGTYIVLIQHLFQLILSSPFLHTTVLTQIPKYQKEEESGNAGANVVCRRIALL